ncbi:MAG: DUF5017 domain-containing protein [Bacteroidetes bacterium]|nr:MAG: DUF5017 domain-containing protein [Bacteroidota bacterium]
MITQMKRGRNRWIGAGMMAVALVYGGLLTSCKKEFDSPPENVIPTGKKITISELIAMHNGAPLKFTEDYSVFGVVSMDENTGNLYKNIFIQDQNAGINVRLLNSGGVYEGDSVRVYLKGTVLSIYNGVYQIDSVDVDKNIIKQKTKVPVTPITVTIDQLNDSHQARLIKLNGVEFLEGELGGTFADAVNQSSQNRTLTDCSGNLILVRTSGFASFAGDKIPTGRGSIIGVLSRYNSDLQLYIRTPDEADMNGVRCDGSTGEVYLSKDFNDGSITSGGWLNYLVSGTDICKWTVFGTTDGAAKVSNFDGTSNTACESWLISPSMDLSGAVAPIMTFRNTKRYNGAELEMYVSTDYDGTSDPSAQGTWTSITSSAVWDQDASGWTFVDSGPVDLSAYKAAKVYIGFKYIGSGSDGRTWELDNISVKEN